MKSISAKFLLASALFALALNGAAQQHGHLSIGAASINVGSLLTFDNGPDFDAASGYVKTLVFTNAGPYSNYFHGNITLTALSRTLDHPEFGANAASFGAFLHAGIVAVEGPAGGEFAFWESGAAEPTISVPSGGTSPAIFRISENDGSPGSDPYGHIHGRRVTATKAGIYRVTFRAWDLALNAPGGGPIHLPSEPIDIYFQSGINIASVTRTGTTARVTFGSEVNRTYALEYTTALTGTSQWNQTGATLTGNDYFQQLLDNEATNAARFYRVKVMVSEP